MKFGFTDKQLDNVIEIISRFKEAESVIIFGSRALGNNDEGSDVDLAIIGRNVNDSTISKIKIAFEESSSPFLFDIVDYNNIKNNKLREQIDKFGLNLYKQDK